MSLYVPVTCENTGSHSQLTVNYSLVPYCANLNNKFEMESPMPMEEEVGEGKEENSSPLKSTPPPSESHHHHHHHLHHRRSYDSLNESEPSSIQFMSTPIATAASKRLRRVYMTTDTLLHFNTLINNR